MKTSRHHDPPPVSTRHVVGSSNSGTPSRQPIITTTSKREYWTLTAARGLFVVVLSAAAAGLGYASFRYLRNVERDVAHAQFASIATRALAEAVGIAVGKRWMIASMATVVQKHYQNASEWPLVALPGFEAVAHSMLKSTRAQNMGFCPLVWPDQAPAFEDFIYNFYYNTRQWPADTAVNSFGRGIWRVDKTLTNSTDFRTHDDGRTTGYNSPNAVLFPVAQVNQGPDRVLLFNLHAEPNRGRAIDDMMDCVAAQTQSNQQEASSSSSSTDNKNPYQFDADTLTQCGVITEMLEFVKAQTKGPTSMMFQPIVLPQRLNNDTTSGSYTLVGLIPTPMLWDTILENVFSKTVSGVDCVLQTESQVFTWTVRNGVAVPVGPGDWHAPEYAHLVRSTAVGQDLFTAHSPNYTLHLYPNPTFFETYETNNPPVATALVVACMVLTSALFFLYDALMRRAFGRRDQMLQAKRAFMRFVSHEVRTPLNTVCLGLSLLQQEMMASLVGGPQPRTVAQVRAAAEYDDCPENATTLEWFQLTDEILQNTQSAVHVLNDLLNYDKVESGTFQLELTVLNIWKSVQDTVGEFRLSAQKQSIVLQMSFLDHSSSEAGTNDYPAADDEEEASPHGKSSRTIEGAADCSVEMQEHQVIGDPVRVVQVLRNLTSNAIKFTPPGGVVQVCAEYFPSTMSAVLKNDRLVASNSKEKTFVLAKGKEIQAKPQGYVKVSVQDSGAGMTPEQLQKLFQEGMQFNARELQAGQGSGFGLCFAKALVELHHGTLVATSEGLGQGSIFTVTLPLYHLPPVSDSAGDSCPSGTTEPLPNPDSIEAGSTAATLNVLVVDDATPNRRFLARILEKAGHVVEQAADGQIALEMVREKTQKGERYDSILSDYEMPRLNGPDFVQAIRAEGYDVFVVGVTGNMLSEDRDYFLECGANAVFPKPFVMSDLQDLWVENGIL